MIDMQSVFWCMTLIIHMKTKALRALKKWIMQNFLWDLLMWIMTFSLWTCKHGLKTQ